MGINIQFLELVFLINLLAYYWYFCKHFLVHAYETAVHKHALKQSLELCDVCCYAYQIILYAEIPCVKYQNKAKVALTDWPCPCEMSNIN